MVGNKKTDKDAPDTHAKLVSFLPIFYMLRVFIKLAVGHLTFLLVSLSSVSAFIKC